MSDTFGEAGGMSRPETFISSSENMVRPSLMTALFGAAGQIGRSVADKGPAVKQAATEQVIHSVADHLTRPMDVNDARKMGERISSLGKGVGPFGMIRQVAQVQADGVALAVTVADQINSHMTGEESGGLRGRARDGMVTAMTNAPGGMSQAAQNFQARAPGDFRRAAGNFWQHITTGVGPSQQPVMVQQQFRSVAVPVSQGHTIPQAPVVKIPASRPRDTDH